MKRIITIALIALSLVGCTGIIAAVSPTPPAQAADPAATAEVITVQGSGTISVKPDSAEISFGVAYTKATAKEAMDETSKYMNDVMAAIKSAGVADDDIRTSNLQIRGEYDYAKTSRELIGYYASNEVRVHVRDLAKMPELIDAATTAGANTMDYMQMKISDPSKAYEEALKDAVKNAKAKADVLAAATGTKTGRVVEVIEGGTQYAPLYAADARAMSVAAGAVPIASGTLDVTATVSVSYAIER